MESRKTRNLSRSIMSNDIEAVIKNIPFTKKSRT
jgi:hypothetical protein